MGQVVSDKKIFLWVAKAARILHGFQIFEQFLVSIT